MEKLTGDRETYRRNLQGVKRFIGETCKIGETYRRNIHKWRDIQGRETYRSGETYMGGGDDLQKGEKFTEWLRNLQGYRDLHKKKLTGGRKTYNLQNLESGGENNGSTVTYRG